MQQKRRLSLVILAVAGLLAGGAASAIGWGRAPQTAVLGQVLDFPVALRLDPGDSIEPRCVSAEVHIGDVRLPTPAVRVGVDNPNAETLAIRVLTDRVVDEPVVTVTVAVGCPARMSRRFVLLADPPSLATAPLPMAAAVAPVAAMPPVTVAASEPAPLPRVAAPAPAAEAPPVRRPPAPPRKPRKPAPAPAEAPVARLKLDDAEPVRKADPAVAAASATESAVAEAFQAVAAAASAARAAASAASAAEARIATLEQTVAQLRTEANTNRDTIAQLRNRLAQADRGGRWTLPLLVAVVGLLALTLWLALRMRRIDAERVRAWRAAAAAQNERPATPTSQLPMVTTEIPVPPTLPPSPPYPSRPAVVGAPAPLVAPPPDDRDLDIALDSTEVLPVGSVADPGSPRDVTIEELLDLEQQAEFFIVLGQDDAAVDLLVHHLRDTGGGSPLPYLKLLEIYRRRGEREAYERTRTRFNHRFNAYAPEWEADLLTGRSLEAYAGVIPRLQQVWPRPMDAMAELEALLFRKSRGDLFDLPAYREVLFLYSLARDLLDREAADSGNVDLLLPLADGGEFSSTSPHPYLQIERDSVFDPGLPVDRPTAPVDLDLSQPGDGGPDSIVQPLNPKG